MCTRALVELNLARRARRRRSRRPSEACRLIVTTCGAAAIALVSAGPARAANLVLDAPGDCVDPAMLAQEVADLVGRPLSEIPEVDFRLTIRPSGGGRWHSTLEAIEHRPGVPPTRHARELEARSCADLAEAAAVAMSVSIRAMTGAAPGAPRPPTAVPAPPSAPPQPAILIREAPPPGRAAWRGLLSAALAGDAGDLPGAGLGVGLGIGARRGATRLSLLGGWIPPRATVRSDGTGGSFQLGFSGAEACFAPSRGNWTALGCAGAEVGIQHGTSLGAAVSGSGTAFWRAGRATLGFVFRSSDRLGLLVTATAVVPLARPEFVLDESSSVYRASPVAARVAAGLELNL